MAWVSHALTLLGLSLFATITLLPLSAVDAYYISTFNKYWFVYTVVIIIIVDVFSAFITYSFAHVLVRLIVRSEKNKIKLERVGERLARGGRWGITLFAATPLPYSLAIYFYAGAQVGFKSLAIPLMIGRVIKYSVITIGILYGIELLVP